eukprot:1164901-Amphidinium_carterae.1
MADDPDNVSLEFTLTMPELMWIECLAGIEEQPLRQAQLAVQTFNDEAIDSQRADAREEVAVGAGLCSELYGLDRAVAFQVI